MAVYLGGYLSTDGNPRTELTRRIGEAKGAFQKLSAVWSHANVTRQRKTLILETCIFSKLLYGLESCMLLAADREKLDGFQARCLRKIYKIPPAFISRVSNAEVRDRSGAGRLSTTLLQRQLKYYGKLARDQPRTLPRQMVFQEGQAHKILPRKWNIRRKRGRPRVQWGHYMHACSMEMARDDPDRLQDLLSSPPAQWEAAVVQYCR